MTFSDVVMTSVTKCQTNVRLIDNKKWNVVRYYGRYVYRDIFVYFLDD